MDELKSLLSKQKLVEANTLARRLEQHADFPRAVSSTKAIVTATMILGEIHAGSLEGAKFVWRRATADVKALRDVWTCWELAKLLWLSNWSGFFAAAAAAEASSSVKRGIAATAGQVREQLLQELGEAYSAISVASMSTTIGLSEADTLAAAAAHGWSRDRKTLRRSTNGAGTPAAGSGSSSSSAAAAELASSSGSSAGPAVALSTLRKLTTYVSSLEQAPLVADVETAAVAALAAASADAATGSSSSSSSSAAREGRASESKTDS